MSSLLELPSELLELNVCQCLDVVSVSQLSLVNRSVHQDITHCSKLWETLVARHFGYVNKPAQAQSNSDNSEISWREVFIAGWQDYWMLTPATLQESDVLHVYHQKLRLQPREAQIRQEIVLMLGLRRIPSSVKLIQLYANVIRQAHLVPRVGAASTARALRRLAL
ncbi:hypothetical protein PPTG_19373 [Phytophthora nicotianae INRA-310]|uniref:F-box domain-containing protein n=1 Tax=Phytophthora nicotianae (strain INRA-310) TaxID=761204 RepID=W2PF87_PHYN3|nr:hypothetical protein PPTG_19373 [Phytophthora nicotianae INRA-310]ETM98679.1 hypothetical protein PPTG_19373 [Phytophthora nicotianae INRA-310]